MKWLDTAKDFLDSKGGIILGIVTLVALGGAVACAINDTSKVKEKKEAEEERREEAGEEPMDTKDNIIFYAKAYAPTIVCTTIAAAGIISYVAIGEKKVMALSTACSASDLIAKSYQRAVKETLPEEEAKKVEDAVVAQTGNVITSQEVITPINNVCLTGVGHTLFKDVWSGRYFYSTKEHLQEVIDDICRDVEYEMSCTLNEWYVGVGLDETEAGDLLVWDLYRGCKIKMVYLQPIWETSFTDQPVTPISFSLKPLPDKAYKG